MRLRRWQSERGSVMVEFAMVLPVFLLIAWCVIDFARAFYTANSLATAVREGARYAAVKEFPASATSVDTARMKVTAAFNAFGGPPIPVDSIIVTDDTANGRVTVTVRNYVWTTTTPINLFTGGQIKMTKTATFRWEREDTE